MDEPFVTKKSLLIKIQDQKDENAWEDFVSYYEEFIKKILIYFKIPSHDRDDLVQEILLKIWNNVKKFDYDPNRAKFRTWLQTVIRNSIYDFWKKKKVAVKSLSIDEIEIETESTSHEIDEKVEREWKMHVTSLALKNLEASFKGNAIDVFKDSLNGKDIKEIAQSYNLTEKSIYVLRKRVETKLIQEIQEIKNEIEF